MTRARELPGVLFVREQLAVLGERRPAAGGGGHHRDVSGEGSGVATGEALRGLRKPGMEMKRAATALTLNDGHHVGEYFVRLVYPSLRIGM